MIFFKKKNNSRGQTGTEEKVNKKTDTMMVNLDSTCMNNV